MDPRIQLFATETVPIRDIWLDEEEDSAWIKSTTQTRGVPEMIGDTR